MVNISCEKVVCLLPRKTFDSTSAPASDVPPRYSPTAASNQSSPPCAMYEKYISDAAQSVTEAVSRYEPTHDLAVQQPEGVLIAVCPWKYARFVPSASSVMVSLVVKHPV